MKYFLILKNGEPEKLIDEMDQDEAKKEDISFWMLTHQILNVYGDEEIAKLCFSSMKETNPELELKMVELHQIDNTTEWN